MELNRLTVADFPLQIGVYARQLLINPWREMMEKELTTFLIRKQFFFTAAEQIAHELIPKECSAQSKSLLLFDFSGMVELQSFIE